MSYGRTNNAKKSTSETPYGLVYESEVDAPTEIAVAFHRVMHFEAMTNDIHYRVRKSVAKVKTDSINNL